MANQFKPVRFFVLIGLLAFLVCGVTTFFTHRAAHGQTSEERSAYVIGAKAGEQAEIAGGSLPTAADLNGIAQRYFERQGAGEPMAWKLAFEHGYEDALKKAQQAR